jgi:undecaprenyl-diphosphatase
VSRSGSTISTAIGLGIDRNQAAHFSFLMVVPLLLGKMAKDLLDGNLAMSESKAMPLLVGFLFSLFVGIVACRLMLKIVHRAKLAYFGVYCMLIGLTAVIIKIMIG